MIKNILVGTGFPVHSCKVAHGNAQLLVRRKPVKCLSKSKAEFTLFLS